MSHIAPPPPPGKRIFPYTFKLYAEPSCAYTRYALAFSSHTYTQHTYEHPLDPFQQPLLLLRIYAKTFLSEQITAHNTRKMCKIHCLCGAGPWKDQEEG